MGMVFAEKSAATADFQGRPAFLNRRGHFPVIFGDQLPEYGLVIQNFLVHQGDFPVVTPDFFQFFVESIV